MPEDFSIAAGKVFPFSDQNYFPAEPPHDENFVPGQLAEPEVPPEQPEINFDNFNHCFGCGADANKVVKLKVIGQQKLCQKCRNEDE